MKKFAMTICALALVAFSFGQTSDNKGKLQFNAGIGYNWGGIVYVGADYFIMDDISIGAEAELGFYSYWHYDEHDLTDLLGGWRTGIFIAPSVNGNYHFNRLLKIPEKFDVYAGVTTGFYIGRHDYSFPFDFSTHIGGRLKMNSKMWLHAETGWGWRSGGAKIGFTFKL
ncbi:MAG: hypothetical protein NTV01_04905 [Bacteroidia bacterium]|nr:hypothetical protein [Bacteroidia bacterium]